jgi:chemotaxis protein MotB
MAKKKRGHDEGHENAERWLLTYADMITLLMLFFIVLWSMSQVDQEKYEKISEALGNILNGGDFGILNWNGGKPSPGLLEGAKTEGGTKEATATGVRKTGGGAESLLSRASSQLALLIRGGKARVTADERGLVISVGADVGFGPDAYELDPEGLRVVLQLADFVRQLPNKVIVEGHTDGAPIDKTKYSSAWELSALRAVSVLTALEMYGVTSTRLSATGYGSTRQLKPNDTPEGRAYNRRVELVIVNEQ